MSGGCSLLERVQGLLERTYQIRHRLEDVGRFIVGDEGFHRLYGSSVVSLGSRAATACGARTLVRETDREIRVSVYLPDVLVRCLEDHPPQRGLRDSNVDAFATLVEELDHLLCIAERAAEERPLTLFELELHANVSKHLVLSRFLAGPGRSLTSGRRRWLRYHLFEKGSFCDEDPEVRSRYRDAVRWAVRLLVALERRKPAERIETLRRFHIAPASGKLALIARAMA